MSKSILGLLIITCFVAGCEDKTPIFVESVYGMRVYNNSDKLVNCFYQNNYPDALLPQNRPPLAGIRPNDFTFLDSKEKWEKVFKKSPRDTLSFFILSVDTLQKYSWQIIRQQNKILKRYDLSLQDLENKGYKINYP